MREQVVRPASIGLEVDQDWIWRYTLTRWLRKKGKGLKILDQLKTVSTLDEERRK